MAKKKEKKIMKSGEKYCEVNDGCNVLSNCNALI
jgi:hypothetical protein